MTITKEQIRILVQDNGVPPIIDDTELDLIIAMEPTNFYRAAAIAARSLAAYFAKKVALTAGPVKLALTEKFEHYQDLADSYDQRAREGGGIDSDAGVGGIGTGIILTGVSVSDMDDVASDEDRPPSVFYMGVTDGTPPNGGV